MADPIKCPVCEKKFIKRVYNQIYCSHKCQISHNNGYGRKPLGTISCEYCGKKFKQKCGAQRYCCTECRKKAAHQSKPVVEEYKHCKWCGSSIFIDSEELYCSEECKEQAHRSQESKKRRKYKRKNPNRELEKTNQKAKAMGLSYGQYVSKYGG